MDNPVQIIRVLLPTQVLILMFVCLLQYSVLALQWSVSGHMTKGVTSRSIKLFSHCLYLHITPSSLSLDHMMLQTYLSLVYMVHCHDMVSGVLDNMMFQTYLSLVYMVHCHDMVLLLPFINLTLFVCKIRH